MIISLATTGLQEAITRLKQGGESGVVIYPTESSYGIGCRADDVIAVGNVFALKERAVNKTVLILVTSVEEAKKIIEWSPVIDELAERYWPGPLSIVARATEAGHRLAPGVLAEDETIALRVSSHPIAQALTQAVGPIVSSSANRGSERPCYDLSCLRSWLGEDAEVLILDAGALPQKLHSTVVKVKDDGYDVLRKGAIGL